MSRIFLAGASGVIGRRLTPLLVDHGHSVLATTRSPDNGTGKATAALGWRADLRLDLA